MKSTSRNAKRLFTGLTTVAVAALGAATLSVPAAQAQASVSHSDEKAVVTDFPVQLGTCVNSGSGEVLLLSGSLHHMTAVMTDAEGGFHATVHTNLVSMSAVGTSSGDVYRVTDTARGFGDRLDVYFPPGSTFPRTVTENSSIRFVSAGSGENLLIRDTYHLTINAEGDVTVDSPTFAEDCVG